MPRLTDDPRTIVLAEDGRFVTLGRHSTPTEAEVAQAGEGLARHGFAGWLATMSGTFYARRCPTLTMLRPIAGSPDERLWQQAVGAFQQAHAASHKTLRQRARA
jgi:hypothetical protein